MRLYKVLNTDGTPFYGGSGTWSLPTDGPGEWMPKIDKIVPCRSGYHVCTIDQLIGWLGPAIFEVEVRGERVDHGDKIVVGEARLVRRLPWDDMSARRFAADCAERVLPIFEKAHPGDDRPRQAIEAARLFVDGKIDAEAWAAAWAAARAAAWAAAQDAAWAVAWATARAAAWAAAQDAAWAAAQDAERRWQTERLVWYLDAEGRQG